MNLPTRAQHQHVVEFYDSESFLVGTASGFVAPALHGGDAAIAPTATFDAQERLGTFLVGGRVAAFSSSPSLRSPR